MSVHPDIACKRSANHGKGSVSLTLIRAKCHSAVNVYLIVLMKFEVSLQATPSSIPVHLSSVQAPLASFILFLIARLTFRYSIAASGLLGNMT